jgi:hypothetical protein
MKKLLFLLLFSLPVLLSAQVVNFAKTLPERAWSIGLTPAWHADRNVILFDAGGASFAFNGGYGLLYSLDLNARYVYFMNGTDYIGLDAQYLVYEARKSYFSVIGGLHKWDQFGLDITGLFTYTPRYEVSLSIGLDVDASFASEINPRVWVPLNVGFNVNEMMFLFAEYNLPVSDRSWDIAAVGINLILR